MKISVTLLEEFHLMNTTSWYSEADFLQSFHRTKPKNERMKIGEAFHNILRSPKQYVSSIQKLHGNNVLTYQDIYINYCSYIKQFSQTDEAIDGCWESYNRRDIQDQTITAKADILYGTQVHEIKCLISHGWDIDKYMESFQWRFYLLIFQALSCVYHIFNLDVNDNIYFITDYNKIEMFPYERLENDCCNIIDEYIQYLKSKGLYT